jgi:hypothetical protein
VKKLIQISFAAALAAALCMGGLGHAQTSEVSSQAAGGQSPGVAPASGDARAPSDPESMPPEAAAFVYYFRIQVALSEDSLTNVAANARALADVLRKDTSGAFPAQFAAQASALARDAVTLSGARLDFTIISGQLMNYLRARNPPVGLFGPIHLVHDPETKLYWLQTGELVQNPYLGKTGPRTGTYTR